MKKVKSLSNIRTLREKRGDKLTMIKACLQNAFLEAEKKRYTLELQTVSSRFEKVKEKLHQIEAKKKEIYQLFYEKGCEQEKSADEQETSVKIKSPFTLQAGLFKIKGANI